MTILEGDAEDLPFPTDSADRYVSAGTRDYYCDSISWYHMPHACCACMLCLIKGDRYVSAGTRDCSS